MSFTLTNAEMARMRRALRTRDDYDFRCQDCGAPHNVDTSLPSEVWNAIAENRPGLKPGAAGIGMPEVTALCTLCIDERLQKAGLKCDAAEFYYTGSALSSRLYAESHGDVARLEARVRVLEEALRATTDHLLAGIREDGGSGGPDPQPPEPADEWSSQAATHVVANRQVLAS